MLEELAKLPGLGSTSAALLIDVGVDDRASLCELGAVGAFRALRSQFGKRITINWIYALECAIHGLHWRMLSSERKAVLKAAAKEVIQELEGNFS